MARKNHLQAADRELLALLSDISAGLRCCRQDVFNCEGLGFSQFLILDLAAQRPELPQTELAAALSLEKSTVTRLVGPMLARGLLFRRRSQADGRAASLVITEAGRDTLGKVWDCVRGFFGGVMAAVPPERRAAVLDTLREFAAALRGAQSAPVPQAVNSLDKVQ